MTLKDIIQEWTPRSLRRLALAGTLAVSGVAGAKTTLVPVSSDTYTSGPGYSGVAVAYDGSNRYVHASKDAISREHIFTQDLEDGPRDLVGHDIGNSKLIVDQASAGLNMYHLKDDGEVVQTDVTDTSIIPSFSSIGSFPGYDHLAAVQIDSGDDAGDYLILVDKDGSSPHYKIWKVGEGLQDTVSLPGQLSIPMFPFTVHTTNTRGAGAYLASRGTDEDPDIESIIIGLNLGGAVAFFREGIHLEDRYSIINGVSGITEDVAFNTSYDEGAGLNQNRTEVYVSTSNGTVARLAIDIGGGEYENLPIYVNPVATITGDTQGLEDEQPNPQISITLTRHPNDPYHGDSTKPVPEVPITVEYTTGGSATQGSDYTISNP
jgi:hypothetical protein